MVHTNVNLMAAAEKSDGAIASINMLRGAIVGLLAGLALRAAQTGEEGWPRSY
jgi:hypothetical protein